MRPRTFVPLLGVGALLIATGVTIQVASADERPQLTSEYVEAGFWNGGLIGTFTIRNPTKTAVSDWRLSFGLSDGARVAGVWNGALSTTKDHTFVVKSKTRTLGANGVLTVGFTALTNVHAKPTNCLINDNPCKISTRSTVDTAAAPTRPGDPTGLAAAPAPATGSATGRNPGKGGGTIAPRPAGPAKAVTPYVNLAATDRPSLTSIAKTGDTSSLELMSAVPSAGRRCELSWGGTTLDEYAGEIRDALADKLSLIAAVGAGSGVDLASACGSAQALQAQLQRVMDLGIRSLDLSVPANGGTASAVWAKAVKALKAQYLDLTVSYTIVSGAVETITRPLAVAAQNGAVIDRVNILPVDLADTASSLDRVQLSDTVSTLLATAQGVHDRLMALQGLDAATAWHHLGIVPVLGAGDRTGGPDVQQGIDRVTGFVKDKGVGMLGFLPLGADRQCAGLLALTCLDANILPQVFALTDLFNNGLA
jgi:hypothetical protein